MKYIWQMYFIYSSNIKFYFKYIPLKTQSENILEVSHLVITSKQKYTKSMLKVYFDLKIQFQCSSVEGIIEIM